MNALNSFLKTIMLLALTAMFVAGSFGGYEVYKYLNHVKERPWDTVIVHGKCTLIETEEEIRITREQIAVIEMMGEKFEGVIRKTGESVICTKAVVIEVIGAYDHLPAYLRPKTTTEIIPQARLKIDDSHYKKFKNSNLLMSGVCEIAGKELTLTHEPSTVIDVVKVKGKYQFKTLLFNGSRHANCTYDKVSYTVASDYQIEKAKLDNMPPNELVGKYVFISGPCVAEVPETHLLINLIASKAKVISVVVQGGKAVEVKVGVKSRGKIVNCGVNGSKFVLEPYLEKLEGNE